MARHLFPPIFTLALVVAATVGVACGGSDDGVGPIEEIDGGASSDESSSTSVDPDVEVERDGGAAQATIDGGPDAAVADGGPTVPTATHVVTTEQASGSVMVFDFAVTDWSKPNAVLWTWKPPGTTFSNLSDVKYTRDGKRVLVAASGGGIAAVDVATKKLLFNATPGGNTHAVEEMPNGNFVSASSTGGFLKLYAKAGVLLQTVSFPDAHAVYWDEVRKRLWAGGTNVVKAFTYSGTAIAAAGAWTLPNGASTAHDLFPLPASNGLFVTFNGGVFVFDRTALTFGAYTSGPDRSGIKAMSQNPGSKTVCLARATNAPGTTPRSWSTDTILFDQPGSTPATVTRVRKGAQFYKARWAVATP